MRRSLFVAAIALMSACYDVPHPVCGFSCVQSTECPDGYTCDTTGDGRCHAIGAESTFCGRGDGGVDQDVEAPRVFLTPQDGESNLDPFLDIIAMFSEPVRNVTVDTFYVTQVSTGLRVAGFITTSETEFATYRFRPNDGRYLEGTQYEIHLTSAITDLAKIRLVDTASSFTTAPPLPPALSFSIPNDGQLNVEVTTAVQMLFSERTIDFTPLFHLRDTNGVAVAGLVDQSNGTDQPQFIPTFQLMANTLYIATIDAGLMDLLGNATTQPITFRFTTGEDRAGTRIRSRRPGFNVFDVAVDTTIQLDFDEAVTGVSETSILLQQGGVNVPATVTYNAAGKSAIIRPINQLAGLTNYEVLTSLNSAIFDLAGNVMPFDSYGFQTTTDQRPPHLRITAPRGGATNVARDTAVVMVFDEPTMGMTTSTVMLTNDDDGTDIPGALTSANGGREWTFTPSALLPASTRINVGVSSPTDAFNNSTSYAFSFTTGP